MQSLPTTLTTRQLDELVSQFPSSCVIFKGEDIVVVKARNKKTGSVDRLLSAASPNGHHWHVMAKPGIVTTSFSA